MASAFSTTWDADGFRVRAEQRALFRTKPVPTADWHALPDPLGHTGKGLLAAAERGGGDVSAEHIFLSHAVAGSLPTALADAAGFPALAKLSVTLSLDSRVEAENGFIRARWHDHASRVVHPARTGVVVTWGDGRVARLSAPLFALAEAVEGYNASVGALPEPRLHAWQHVQHALARATGEAVTADAVLSGLTIYQAGAFALDVRETRDGPDFAPVLMGREKRASLEDDAPSLEAGDEPPPEDGMLDAEADALLPPDLQRRFITDHAVPLRPTRDAYVLGRNTFVVLEPELKVALDVVREMRSAPAEERRAFLRNPRPRIAAALGQTDGLSSSLFVETGSYSERVLGLGLWEPPVMPWLTRKSTQWLPELFELVVGERRVQITPERLDALEADIASAKGEGRSEVDLAGAPTSIAAVEAAIADVRGEAVEPASSSDLDSAGAEEADGDDRQVLQIKDNIEEVEYTLKHPPRRHVEGARMPLNLLSPANRPKEHQVVGFDWLAQSWLAGLPGVLLADDMGLGKTYQALAFLAWSRRAGGSRVGPILVVAPTALLQNWAAEAERHLVPGALGERVDAFGTKLRSFRPIDYRSRSPEDAIDVDRLRGAGWILTTYETLADNHRAFARLRCAVAIFDEMQKIKAPGTINTHAAKAINADFVLGMTGTPIENRLEDLWCLMDRVVPGHLGDLKSFAQTHTEGDAVAMTELKAKLDRPQGQAPAVMLRRLKEDVLDGLPEKIIRTYPMDMPGRQAEAYGRVVRQAQAGDRSPGAMLKVLHAMRGLSLHPDRTDTVVPNDVRSVRAWVDASARLSETVRILDEVEQRGEKALLFIEDRDMQALFAASAGTLFKLRSEPQVINGEVPGNQRQAIVDRFQKAPAGFDVLVLSPKAAGVGLTITAANHVIHLSRWWNPAVEAQCNDRAYRIGQTKPVTVHIPLARHPVHGDASFDVTLDTLLAKKRALSRHMLTPPVNDGDAAYLFESTIGQL